MRGRSDGSSKSVTTWPWRSTLSPGDSQRFPESFFLQKTELVARHLLGARLSSTIGGERTEGVIVETEAYTGPQDPASHAAERIGETRRNKSMFGSPGRAYVYRSYGIHWCLNVVTQALGFPAAVLIRSVEPLQGEEAMGRRRNGRRPLCAGPGRLTQAMGISGELDGHPLHEEPLTLWSGWTVSEEMVGVSGRIGVSEASDWPLRFYLRGHPGVSRTPR